MRSFKLVYAFALLSVISLGCGDDDHASVDSGTDGGADASSMDANMPPIDAGMDATDDDDSSVPTIDSGMDATMMPSDCFVNPTTHFEIINACTTAEAIDKDPELPLLPDGGLPELPQ